MTTPALFEQPHRRLNLLTGEWLLVSPHRTGRPWQGAVEKVPAADRPVYDPACYLCPGNARAGGAKNPPYDGTFVFDNDFAALLPDVPEREYESGGLLQASSERGRCRGGCPVHACGAPRAPACRCARRTDRPACVARTRARRRARCATAGGCSPAAARGCGRSAQTCTPGRRASPLSGRTRSPPPSAADTSRETGGRTGCGPATRPAAACRARGPPHR